jgi:hypothetical protein
MDSPHVQLCFQALGDAACSSAGVLILGLQPTRSTSYNQEVWAGPSWSSFAFKVRSLLLHGFQDPPESALL